MRLVRVGPIGSETPDIFQQGPNTVVGPDDDVIVSRGCTKTGGEVELGVGSHASYLADETEAEAAIAGYVLVNDVSERDGKWSEVVSGSRVIRRRRSTRGTLPCDTR